MKMQGRDTVGSGYGLVLAVNKWIIVISRNWQYKDVNKKIMNNQHHTCIHEANYYLSVFNVHFKLALSTE